ncbi:LysR family transcriptional regulator [Bifidobacterium leontopitheci]|uniref:LysR family transcriptional regulator n=1 Tax=Bifidobacterium leontopitheci TaxID=2650774 RepID=A0A6I1GRD8_9BIFI|nr:LysR family transcriptional regulator [Bifidobacterium leontopitheci]KAB7790708.1 LysR family transcriptional regulator [Bifidobacterium leontopitheci]
MELRVLRYFLAVAEEGNITWAAQLLRISQPTLSRQLKQLEEELGVTLFERGAHAIALTEEGRLLRDRAQIIVSLADKTQDDLKRSSGELSGDITAGCGEVGGMTFLAGRMAAFRGRHPAVRFHVVSATADVIQERMEQGIMDFGLLAEPVDTDRYETLRTGVVDHWAAMVPDGHPLHDRESLTPADLADEPLLLPSREPVRRVVANWFGPLADRLTIAGTCTLPANGATMAAGGLGLYLCLDRGAGYPGVRAVPFSPALESSSVIVWKRQGAVSPAAAAFARFLRS